MTKLELLGHDENGKKLSLEEVFELEQVHLRWRVNSLITSLSASFYQSRLYDYNQKRVQEKFLSQLTEFYNEVGKWQFNGEKKQLEFDF